MYMYPGDEEMGRRLAKWTNDHVQVSQDDLCGATTWAGIDQMCVFTGDPPGAYEIREWLVKPLNNYYVIVEMVSDADGQEISLFSQPILVPPTTELPYGVAVK